MTRLILLGTGVFAEEVADIVSDIPGCTLLGFGENLDRERTKSPLLGLPVHWYEDLITLDNCEFVCAIGTTKRVAFTREIERLELPLGTVAHPTARLSRTSTLGRGSILSVGVMVASHTTLGRHVIVNRGALIGHHTTIGDHVTISPGANIGGRVTIGDGAYIGMGSIVLNDVKVGKGSIVGAGAVVTKDVPERVLVVGIPAKVTREEVEGL